MIDLKSTSSMPAEKIISLPDIVYGFVIGNTALPLSPVRASADASTTSPRPLSMLYVPLMLPFMTNGWKSPFALLMVIVMTPSSLSASILRFLRYSVALSSNISGVIEESVRGPERAESSAISISLRAFVSSFAL